MGSSTNLGMKTSNLLVEFAIVQSVQASEDDKKRFAGFAGFGQALGIVGLPRSVGIAQILPSVNEVTASDKNGQRGSQAIGQGHKIPPMVLRAWDIGPERQESPTSGSFR